MNECEIMKGKFKGNFHTNHKHKKKTQGKEYWWNVNECGEKIKNDAEKKTKMSSGYFFPLCYFK